MTDATEQVPSPAQVALSRAALVVALLVFAFGIVRLGAYAAIAFRYPYAFDYGEGVVWQQMRNIVAGQGYAPLGIYPAVAYEYPPLFHVASATIARVLGMDELYAGRLVSLVSTIASAALVGLLTARAVPGPDRRAAAGAALFSALAFASLPLLDTWALVMRIDMLACALTLAAMLLAARASRSMASAVGAGILFAAALYTRQTALPAPAAAFAVLLIARPRAAWTMAAAVAISGLAALAWLEVSTQGGFLIHILLYNLNRIIWDHAAALLLVLLASIVLLALAAIGGAQALRWLDLRDRRGLRARLRQQPSLVATAIILLTLLFKTLMLPAVLKSGASDNYLIDWFTQLCMLAGIAVIPLIHAARRQPGHPSIVLIALVAVGLPVQALSAGGLPDAAAADRQARDLDLIVARIAASPRPVISDDAALLIRAGRSMQWEPAIVAELGSAGRYDEAAFVAMIRRHDFGFFVTEGDSGDLLFDQRFNPAVADAIHRAYPRRERIGGRILHLAD
ncbi:MAG: hypothetical protein ABIR08_11175 [Sphingomonas sp.]